jgi:hypothetical protein
MRAREVRAVTSDDSSDFAIASLPGDEVFEARGTSPFAVWDVISQCLRR